MSAITWYCYYQIGGEDSWIPALAAARASVMQERAPRYMTVLDLSMNITHDSDRADLDKVTYRGDMYIDIDVSVEAGGIEIAIVQINMLIDKFAAAGVKPETLRIFASGSKGFHLEIPWQTFVDKEPKNGTAHLPLIYKEIVHGAELYVDGIDPRVYSAGRGRMWRSTNVKRENGKHKVQISLEECRNLTPEIYSELVAAPRALPHVSPPVYCANLAVMYASASDTVSNRRKRIIKSKTDPVQLAKWAKKPPGELQHLLTGNGIKDGAGFHPIAAQVALAATSLGWSVDEMLERCEGLIENHRGDGNRYDSPRKRQRELTRMWYYFSAGSGTYYEFALGPIRALLNLDAQQPDMVDQPMPEDFQKEDDEDEEVHDHLLTSGMKVRRLGMFKTVEGNEVRASAIGFSDVTQLHDTETHETTGYQAVMYLDGKRVGEKLMPLNLFTSRQALQGFALANGGASIHLSDGQVTGLAELFRRKAMKSDSRIHIVGREGLDFLKQPNGNVHSVYVSHETYYTHAGEDVPKKYALKMVGRDAAPIRSDILHAPELAGTKVEKEFLRTLFKINKPETMGKLLGWFSACFLSQGIRLVLGKFPLLHVYGTAGSGKTETTKLLANLHYFREEPEIAAGGLLTAFAMKLRLTSSASIPLIWDEVKFHAMKHDTKMAITQFLLNNYVGVKSETGTMSRDTGVSHVDLRNYKNAAPVVFIGETMETLTAIAERYVSVAMSKEDRGNLQDEFNFVSDSREILGHVGKSMVKAGMNLDLTKMRDDIRAYEKMVYGTIVGATTGDSRRIFNYAVALYGLDFLHSVLDEAFPEEFRETIAGLKSALLASIRGDLPKNMSESSKVLDQMAFLTKTETPELYRLVYGQDYTVDDNTVDLKLQNCFVKYLQFQRSLGQFPLFPDYGRFVAAMNKYGPMIDNVCLSNTALKDTTKVDVYRFNLSGLDTEGVELFRGQSGTLR